MCQSLKVLLFRDWSKIIGWGGPEQRGAGSSVFEPLVRGGSCSFQLPMDGGSSYFKRNGHTFICQPAGEMSVEKESSIRTFFEKYAVDQGLVVKYMHQLVTLT